MQENLNNILVSVVIPVHNGASFITETINSVCNQNFQPFEIIVVNDGSTDQTLQILTDLSIKYTKIKILNQDKSGVSAARNNGLKLAQGKYIAFLDADDIWDSDFLKIRIDFLESHPKAFGVTSFYELIDENSNHTGKVVQGDFNIILNDLLQWKGNYITIPSGILFNKNALIQFGSFHEKLSNNADQEIVMRLLSKNFTFHTIQQKSWYYRRHSSNMSSNISVMEKDTWFTFDIAKKENYFNSLFFYHKCMSKTALIIAFSWMKDKQNYSKGLKWLGIAFLYSPVFVTSEFLSRIFSIRSKINFNSPL